MGIELTPDLEGVLAPFNKNQELELIDALTGCGKNTPLLKPLDHPFNIIGIEGVSAPSSSKIVPNQYIIKFSRVNLSIVSYKVEGSKLFRLKDPSKTTVA